VIFLKKEAFDNLYVYLFKSKYIIIKAVISDFRKNIKSLFHYHYAKRVLLFIINDVVIIPFIFVSSLKINPN